MQALKLLLEAIKRVTTAVFGENLVGIYEEGSDTPASTVSKDQDGCFTFPALRYTIAGKPLTIRPIPTP